MYSENIPLSKKQIKLTKQYADNGLVLNWFQPISEDADNVFFFGGTVCEIETQYSDQFNQQKKVLITVMANGDVEGTLLKNGKYIDSFKDRGNSGYRHDTDRYIKTNAQLRKALIHGNNSKKTKGFALTLDDNNWIEFFYDLIEDGQTTSDVIGSYVSDDENIFEALQDYESLVQTAQDILKMSDTEER